MEDLGHTVTRPGPRNEPVKVPYIGPDPRFVAAFYAWRELDRDINGKPTVRGRHDWLDCEGVTDSGVRGFYLDMWRALDVEQGIFDDEKKEADEATRAQQRKQ